jgi:hypothetical protein
MSVFLQVKQALELVKINDELKIELKILNTNDGAENCRSSNWQIKTLCNKVEVK